MDSKKEIEDYVMDRIADDVKKGYVVFEDPDMTVEKYLALPEEEQKSVMMKLTPEGQRIAMGHVTVPEAATALIGNFRLKVGEKRKH